MNDPLDRLLTPADRQFLRELASGDVQYCAPSPEEMYDRLIQSAQFRGDLQIEEPDDEQPMVPYAEHADLWRRYAEQRNLVRNLTDGQSALQKQHQQLFDEVIQSHNSRACAYLWLLILASVLFFSWIGPLFDLASKLVSN